jgi:chromosome segregation ATPase
MSNESPKSSSKSNKQLRQQVSAVINPPSLRLNVQPPAFLHEGGGAGNSKLGHFDEVKRINGILETTIEDLDKKLNRVLAKQEYEYLKGYNIYVKQKEKDLRELIEKLNEKNSNNTLKDEKISKLESTISAIREDQIRQEKEKEKLNENIKYWKTKAQGYEQEKNFLQQQIMDAKRQNKLLKLAIGRLQNELDEKENAEKLEAQEDEYATKAKTFLTESVIQA